MSAADPVGLERRLKVLEDKEALRGLLMRGWRALDHKDWAAWSACWAQDAVLDFGPWGVTYGREAIRETVERAEESFGRMQHHLLNTHFEVDGDRASGIGYMWFVAVSGDGGDGAPYVLGGPYDWEFRRGADGSWLLVRQRLGVWWSDGDGDGAGAPEAFRR
ncbi:nuclear transport factor 2 family protein [Streptomyces sp. NPDC090112]|uniref:nuclear transport factor 2 family protein n=1 Tax=Streptomyces sp. NPDC090112 TaxID=3365949 RepID=UPI00380301A1